MSQEQGLTVLFQGDSITDGGRGRTADLNHIFGHSYPYLIASRLGNQYAEQRPQFINRGISGNRVSDVYARWNEDALSLRPDVISLMLGVNDAGRIVDGHPGGATDRFERAYRHLLEETRDVLPEARLVLCEPFILPVGTVQEKWAQWAPIMAHYRQVVRQLSQQYETVFVPLQDAFEQAATRVEAAYWIWDGVHPTAAGHDLIAQRWLQATRDCHWLADQADQANRQP